MLATEELAARARALGYSILVAAPGHVRPDTGGIVPTVYRIEGFARSTLLRDDENEAWLALIDPDAHERHCLRLTEARPIASAHPPAAATLIGPLPSERIGGPEHDYPQMSSFLPLAEHGYREDEFLLQGTATSYATPAMRDALALSAHPYRTRMIVRRPIDASGFNGTVVVEWLNVSAFSNVDNLWLEAAPELIRQGFVYAGVSVQRDGVHAPATGLRAWSPIRYGSLDVTDGGEVFDDSLCYDIFSQAGLALLRAGSLGALRPRRLLAFGASQSHRRLISYVNSIHRKSSVYDGFLLTIGRGACEVRTDNEAKIMKVNSETDVLSAGYLRQPDSSSLRTWEIAGTSHTSYRLSQSRSILEQRGDIPPIPFELCERPPLSRVPFHHALEAALTHLARWVADGKAPPSAPSMALRPNREPEDSAVRDEFGNALGGIRLSQHAVPTAVNTGLNAGPGYLSLCGTHEPFSAATLEELYPSHDVYVHAVRTADELNVTAGCILEHAAQDNLVAAIASDIGRLRVSDAAREFDSVNESPRRQI